MRSTVFCFLIVSCILGRESSAQPKLWDVYSMSNQPFVNVVVDGYRADSLYVKSMDRVIALHQDSIQYLVHRNKSQFGLGLVVGAVLGGLWGNWVGRESDGPFSAFERSASTLFGAFFGGAIGGAVGLGAGADTKYRLGKLEPDAKRELLRRLFPEPSQ